MRSIKKPRLTKQQLSISNGALIRSNTNSLKARKPFELAIQARTKILAASMDKKGFQRFETIVGSHNVRDLVAACPPARLIQAMHSKEMLFAEVAAKNPSGVGAFLNEVEPSIFKALLGEFHPLVVADLMSVKPSALVGLIRGIGLNRVVALVRSTSAEVLGELLYENGPTNISKLITATNSSSVVKFLGQKSPSTVGGLLKSAGPVALGKLLGKPENKRLNLVLNEGLTDAIGRTNPWHVHYRLSASIVGTALAELGVERTAEILRSRTPKKAWAAFKELAFNKSPGLHKEFEHFRTTKYTKLLPTMAAFQSRSAPW